MPKVNAYYLAQLFYMLEVQTAIAGELYNINTFNQPGVEQAKNYTYALMGRAGYEESREELTCKIGRQSFSEFSNFEYIKRPCILQGLLLFIK